MSTNTEDTLLAQVISDIPAKVQRIKQALNYSDKGLAMELGVSRQTVARWEHGERECKIPKALIRIHQLARDL